MIFVSQTLGRSSQPIDWRVRSRKTDAYGFGTVILRLCGRPADLGVNLSVFFESSKQMLGRPGSNPLTRRIRGGKKTGERKREKKKPKYLRDVGLLFC